MIEELRKRISGEEFDYLALLDSLREYARPRDKITDLLRKEVIVRVKKGIYVFGEKYARRPFSREVLANVIFGPSYVSLDYALRYHGLIPERVEALTSVTCSRSHRFSTPVGLFIYRKIPMRAFQIGIDQVELDEGRPFLIAIPEKALADKIQDDRWGEDGLGGICDNHQVLCLALALWNGNDPILKERLFGLSTSEGNHGEDVKEYSVVLY